MWNSTNGLTIMNPKTRDVIYDVSKKEIIKCNISKVVDLINHMENSMGFEGCNEKLNICFSGYDDDSREIFQIPEIRQYMLKLINTKPYCPYFLTTKDYTRAILMGCIGEVDIVKTENNVNSLKIKIPQDMSLIVISNIKKLAELHNLDVDKIAKSMHDIPFTLT